ncbi:DUF4169 family protein [Aestuariibius sp. 2305UL40-4]|uniref:DUF4169 family protein n=1 Tax=Aestuariibius violaceus TaxID=3234132 RepID=UPI00345E11F7
MTGKVINLRRARKDRARADKKAKGDQSAALHGRAKAERDLTRAEREKSDAHLDGHRRDLE